MTAIVSALIFVLIVALVVVIVIWAVETALGAMGVPSNITLIVRVIIVLIGVLMILNRLLPLAGVSL